MGESSDDVKREEEIVKAREGLSEEKLSEYKDIFSFFDRDGGGTITTVELGQVMRTFGWAPTEGELQELVGEIDQDGNGCITFNEFVWLMTREIHDGDIEEEIREAFRVFDKEGHGFIPVPDLTEVLQKLGENILGSSANLASTSTSLTTTSTKGEAKLGWATTRSNTLCHVGMTSPFQGRQSTTTLFKRSLLQAGCSCHSPATTCPTQMSSSSR